MNDRVEHGSTNSPKPESSATQQETFEQRRNTIESTQHSLRRERLLASIRTNLLSWGITLVTEYPAQANISPEKKRRIESALSRFPEDERLISVQELAFQTQGQLSGAQIEVERLNQDRVVVRIVRIAENEQTEMLGDIIYDSSRNELLTRKVVDEEIEQSAARVRQGMLMIGQRLLDNEGNSLLHMRTQVERALRTLPSYERNAYFESAIQECQSQLSGGRFTVRRLDEGRVRVELMHLDENRRLSSPINAIVYDRLLNQLEVLRP